VYERNGKVQLFRITRKSKGGTMQEGETIWQQVLTGIQLKQQAGGGGLHLPEYTRLLLQPG